MKKIYFTIFSIALATSGFGQVTLQGPDVNASIGESFDYTQTDWISPGSAGANQTWDLTGVTTTSSSTVNFTAANAGFPSTNITYTDVNGGSLYLDYSTSGQDVYGMYDGASVTITYSDPLTMMAFPLSMGTTGSDSHSATFTSGGFPFTRTGTTSWEADGYGTVITPNGTYSNVLRVKQVQTYTDTYSGGTINYNVEIYGWYKAGIHHAVASMSSIVTDFGSNAYGTYLTGNVGLDEVAQKDFTVYPNPATDQIKVQTTDGTVAAVTVTDLSGKVVAEANGTELNITALNAGVYFLTVTTTDGDVLPAQKMIKH